MSDERQARIRIEVPFYAVPAAVAASGLGGASKLLFGCLYSLSLAEQKCTCSQASLARRIGVSARQVVRSLVELERVGLIARRSSEDDGRMTEIVVTFAGKPIAIGGEQCDKMSPKFDDKMSPIPIKRNARGELSGRRAEKILPTYSPSSTARKAFREAEAPPPGVIASDPVLAAEHARHKQ